MKATLIVKQNLERTQLDWDIEDARYELRKTGNPALQHNREVRLNARKFYLDTLEYRIKAALDNYNPNHS
jgi:hypothetical protein